MLFWTYMLQCRGGYFYVGQTDDLARRIAQHEYGAIAGFTRHYPPVALVWSQEFPTRAEARASEKQIKGWSRAKKLALIRRDWDSIAQLAKMKSFLVPHPDKPPLAVSFIRARITDITEHWLTLRWKIASSSQVIVPGLTGKRRADNLWCHTCFELFLQSPGSDAYVELNLSPSESWAAYDFAGYRQGMAERPMPRQPDCTARGRGNRLIFDAAVPMAGLPPLPWRAGLTAVIEEEGGVMSYWASAHPPGKPDFHHPACLALTVPALAPM